MSSPSASKLLWKGSLTSVQPRIRLSRSFDERAHTYQGYILSVRGNLDGREQDFQVAIGRAAQAKHQFHIGDVVSGEGVSVSDPRTEIAHLYKVSKLKVLSEGVPLRTSTPPWFGPPPPLEVYRERRHRRLDARAFSSRCATCIWGCRMPVEIIVDHWNPSVRKYRTETFCYGPLSCPSYRPGPTRKVPGRRGMVYEEPDWIDEQETEHREPDE